MCGRYYIDQEDTLSEMRQIIDAVNRRYQDSQVIKELRLGEISPGQIVPAVRLRRSEDSSVLIPELVRWGFKKPQGKGLLINARSETAAEKPTFRRPLRTARILIPAHAFFEWRTDKSTNKKIKMKCYNPQSEMFYMAAIARQEPLSAPEDASDRVMRFVILTTQANESVHSIHDRMPLIIPGNHVRAFLEDESEAIRILSRPVDIMLSAVQAD